MERRKAEQRNEKRGEKIERRDKRRKKDLSARGRVKREGGEGREGKTMLRSTVRMTEKQKSKMGTGSQAVPK